MNLRLPPARSDVPASSPTAVREGALEISGFTKKSPQWEDSDDDLRSSLINYLILAIKRKYLLAIILGIFLCGAVIVTRNTPKTYSASTTIRIERSVPRVIRDQTAQSDSGSDPGDGEDPQFYETQYELIRSRLLADRVATALNLEETDFLGAAEPSGPAQPSLLSWLRPLADRVATALNLGETGFLGAARSSLLSWLRGSDAAIATDRDANAVEVRHTRARLAKLWPGFQCSLSVNPRSCGYLTPDPVQFGRNELVSLSPSNLKK